MPASTFSTLPPYVPIQEADLPPVARALLAHERDLTPTLEAHHHSPLHIQVLQAERTGDLYRRHVVLLDRHNRPVSMGEIEIELDRLPAPLVEDILAGHRPLGGLLHEHGFPHAGQPQAFFQLSADGSLAARLGAGAGVTLYGRRNHLLDAHGAIFARVVEILAPTPPRGSP
jgi:chorismate-pyruvate lyase